MILARYILREHIAPFLYALFIITFLFLIDFLIRILSSILSKGLAWQTVLEIIVLNLAWMLALSIPMAVLVATLMAFGRFSADNEITAMKANGISPFRAILPVLTMAILLCGGMIYFNNYILPDANHRAAALRNDIGRKKPTALITPHTLIKDFENYQLWIDSLNPVTGRMRGVRIYAMEMGKPLRYICSDSAFMEYARGGKTILIRLYGGENHIVDPKENKNYVRIKYQKEIVSIDNVDAALERHERSYRTDREMSVQDMYGVIKTAGGRLKSLNGEYQNKVFDELQALDVLFKADTVKNIPPRLMDQKWWTNAPISSVTIAEVRKQEQDKQYIIQRYNVRADDEQKEMDKFWVEIHKKFSIPVACLVFVFIGAPLGIMARRGGIGTGSIYSLFFFLLYWACLIRGEVLADKAIITPWMAMWFPNIIVGIAGLFLAIRMSRENYLSQNTWLQKFFAMFKSIFIRRKVP